MADIGMEQQENAEVQQCVAAILCLGNLDFGDASDDQAAISDPNMCQMAMDFLGCADLEQARAAGAPSPAPCPSLEPPG